MSFIFSKYLKKSWSLKTKFLVFVMLSSCIISVILIVGIFKHYNFHVYSNKVEASSKELLTNLKTNFDNTALMAEIQTDFISFTKTAHPEKMQEVMEKSHKLLEQLPKEAHPYLVQFLNQAGKLEIRMASLRTNNQTALSTGNDILIQLFNLGQCEQQKTCLTAVDQASATYRSFHPLYITDVLNGQITTLDRATTEISTTFSQIINNFFEALQSMPPRQKLYITELHDMFMELDESVATVAAIKAKVLTTEHDAITTIHQINTTLNKQSISQQKAALDLSKQGLLIAHESGILLISTLLSFTVLFIMVGLFISKGVISPLIALVKLLQNFSKILCNIRNQNVNDNEQHALFHSTIANREDEIGDVAHATMTLMNHMRTISEFRKKIEDDVTTDDVYSRLSSLFINNLGIRSFVIYEIDKNQTMLPVYIQPSELGDYLPDLTESAICRAKRTGAVVSSLLDPEICPVCRFNDCLNHICIPMLAGGKVIGVAQLIAPISLNHTITDKLNKTFEVAKNYIEEALPVIQAKRFARELEEMATKDQLTGLYNRRYLEISLQQIVAGIKRRNMMLGILMCDIDFFKQVNDAHGHDAGDLVLQELATILQEHVRDADMVIRFGGEEFLILLLDIKENQTPQLAEKIRAAVEDYTFQLAGTTLKKTLSIGTAEFPSTGANGIWEVIKQADIALYKAKDAGRNQVVAFDQSLEPEQFY